MQCMAQEGSEASVASSPPPPPPPSSSTWWPDMHPYSSWPPAAARWPPLPPSAAPYAHHHHPTSSPGAADDNLSASNATMATSFTNTSTNHSGLSMDSPGPAAAAAAAAESHLWNHVLLGTGGEVGRSMHVHDTRDDSENFLELLNSKTLAPELFAEPPACDYLKKMDSSNHSSGSTTWDHFAAAPSSLNSLDKQHLSNSSFTNALLQPAAPEPRLTNLSDLLGNWSIAPPDPCLDHCHRVSPCDGAVIGHAKANFLETSNISPVKHEMEHAANPCHGVMLEAGSCTNQEFMASNSSFARPIGHGYSSMLGLSNKLYGGGGGGGGGVMDVPWAGNAPPRNLSDLISFSGSLSKPAAVKSTAARSPDAFDYKKQGQEISSPVKASSKGSAPTSDGKKRRSEERAGSEGSAKKFKHETSPTSSLKTQVPKVKLGDKITALQQIVSPFGKTDTASVLYEAIHYIKFLHEQVQLLSDPYMKSSSSKDYNAWGGLERKEKVDEAEVDLKSRGLCLVPVSCTPQVYRDNSVPDYWAPPYRSCLYR